MSDTPRTDELMIAINEGLVLDTVGPLELEYLSRTLERELTAATARAEKAEAANEELRKSRMNHRMSGSAGFALQARDALGLRERALRNIKGACSRWYDGTANAESTLRDIESFAVGVWMQEEDIAKKDQTVSPSGQVDVRDTHANCGPGEFEE